MVSEKNDRNIEIMQRLMSLCCLIVTFGSVAVVGMYSFSRSEEYLMLSPKVGADVAENDYVKQSKILVGDGADLRAITEDYVAIMAVGELDTSKMVVDDALVADTPVVIAEAKPERPAKAKARAVQQKKAVIVDPYADVRSAVQRQDFDVALNMLRTLPRGNEYSYIRAKALWGKFNRGEANGRDVIAAWQDVRDRSGAGSRRLAEADSIIGLFR